MDTIVINKDNGNFLPLTFVLKARASKEEYRSHLKILHIEDQKAICTDGKRLHIFPGFSDLGPENYTIVLANTKDIILSPSTEATGFPDWKIVIPEKENCKSFDLDLTCASLKKKEIGKFSNKVFDFIKETNIRLNLSYLSDLTGYKWRVYYGDPDKVAVLFECKYVTAVIAPQVVK